MKIAELRRIEEAATEGPWCWGATGEKDTGWVVGAGSDNDGKPYTGEVDQRDIYDNFISRGLIGEEDTANHGDPAFISASRNHFRALLKVAELDRIAELCRRAEGAK